MIEIESSRSVVGMNTLSDQYATGYSPGVFNRSDVGMHRVHALVQPSLACSSE